MIMNLKKVLFFIFFLISFTTAANIETFYPGDLINKIEDRTAKNDFLKNELFEVLSHQKKLRYEEARKFLFGKLHLEGETEDRFIKDVYCQKKFDKNSKVGEMRIPNSAHINCEHTWPQSRFNRKIDKNLQKGDLHHLYPSEMVANAIRSNHIFAEVEGKEASSLCPQSHSGVAIDTKIAAFEPPFEHKGNTARSLFYFSVRYKLSIGELEEKYLRRWHKEDPVDDQERKRNNEIEEIQKNRNPFIDFPDAVELIEDF